MNFSETFKQALDSLRGNKLRSILTMLGIVMGVFSVITIVALSGAAEAYMNAQFEKLGANIIQIREKNVINSNDQLTLLDLSTIKRVAPEIKNITAYTQKGGEIRIGSKTKKATAIGIDGQAKSFNPIEMAAGRFVTEIDVSTKSSVAVVDDYFAKKYYNKEDITGEILLLKDKISGKMIKLKIVGVTKTEGNLFLEAFGDDYPATVYAPITTMLDFYGSKQVDSISVSVMEKEKLQEIGKRIVKALEFKHNNEDKYVAQNTADMQKTFSNILGVISTVLLIIAIITLVVGGIGIINILLVSVTERIREIGIRKALGAQKRDIIVQFLTESIIMTGTSGIIGIIIGVMAGTVISMQLDIPPSIDIKVIVMSFLGSVLLGLTFGVYPAKRAADLDPIESLRYE